MTPHGLMINKKISFDQITFDYCSYFFSRTLNNHVAPFFQDIHQICIYPYEPLFSRSVNGIIDYNYVQSILNGLPFLPDTKIQYIGFSQTECLTHSVYNIQKLSTTWFSGDLFTSSLHNHKKQLIAPCFTNDHREEYPLYQMDQMISIRIDGYIIIQNTTLDYMYIGDLICLRFPDEFSPKTQDNTIRLTLQICNYRDKLKYSTKILVDIMLKIVIIGKAMTSAAPDEVFILQLYPTATYLEPLDENPSDDDKKSIHSERESDDTKNDNRSTSSSNNDSSDDDDDDDDEKISLASPKSNDDDEDNESDDAEKDDDIVIPDISAFQDLVKAIAYFGSHKIYTLETTNRGYLIRGFFVGFTSDIYKKILQLLNIRPTEILSWGNYIKISTQAATPGGSILTNPNFIFGKYIAEVFMTSLFETIKNNYTGLSSGATIQPIPAPSQPINLRDLKYKAENIKKLGISITRSQDKKFCEFIADILLNWDSVSKSTRGSFITKINLLRQLLTND